MGLLLGDLFYSAVCVTRGTVSGVEVFLHPTVSQQDLLVSMSVKNINSGYFFSTDLEGVTCDGTYLKGSEVTHLGTLKQVSMNTENHWKDERIYHIGLFNTDFSNLRPLVGRVIRNETDESDYVSLACAFSVLVDTKFKYSTSLHLSSFTLHKIYALKPAQPAQPAQPATRKLSRDDNKEKESSFSLVEASPSKLKFDVSQSVPLMDDIDFVVHSDNIRLGVHPDNSSSLHWQLKLNRTTFDSRKNSDFHTTLSLGCHDGQTTNDTSHYHLHDPLFIALNNLHQSKHTHMPMSFTTYGFIEKLVGLEHHIEVDYVDVVDPAKGVFESSDSDETKEMRTKRRTNYMHVQQMSEVLLKDIKISKISSNTNKLAHIQPINKKNRMSYSSSDTSTAKEEGETSKEEGETSTGASCVTVTVDGVLNSG